MVETYEKTVDKFSHFYEYNDVVECHKFIKNKRWFKLQSFDIQPRWKEVQTIGSEESVGVSDRKFPESRDFKQGEVEAANIKRLRRFGYPESEVVRYKRTLEWPNYVII